MDLFSLLAATALADPVVAPVTNPATVQPAQAVNNIFGSVAGVVTLIAGSLAIIYVVLSGIRYITAGSSPDKVKQARAGIINAAIGIGIVVATYGIIRLAIIIGNQINSSVS